LPFMNKTTGLLSTISLICACVSMVLPYVDVLF
jgi:hypothetical protein